MARVVCEEFERNGWVVDAPSHGELDVTDRNLVEAWFRDREPYDLLIANAGAVCDKLFVKQTEQEWDRLMEVNLTGAVWTARSAVEAMMRGKRAGQVIFIGSYGGIHPGIGQCAYASSKAAMAGAAKALAREWGARQIRVNVVCPGFLETRMTAEMSGPALQAALGKHVLGKFTTPADTARFLRFLHEEMPFVSGQIFSLDSRII